ncbi:hypothetical protein ABEB36_002503 [Hypothenemus hampei]|uniref:Saposin B-type domain-containing protein n=1 Tax=Hypothenemus hampei TaxID=57062 RepID=A0ABD1F628_HYPHA
MLYIFLIFSFTQLFLPCQASILTFRTQHGSFKQERILNKPKLDDSYQAELCKENCPCLSCNTTLRNPRKIINPYKELLQSRVAQKPFGTFCVKCAACLAVANEIQAIIENDNQEECEMDLTKRIEISEVILEKISHLCTNGFKNFNLRTYGEHEIFTNNFQCTEHIKTLVEANWTKKLREICSLYMSRIDVELIVSRVSEGMLNLTETFCRGSGIFRDCNNIKKHENITVPSLHGHCSC